MQTLPPPNPFDCNSTGGQSDYSDRPPLPTIDQSEFLKQSRFARRIGRQVAPYVVEGIDELLGFSFILLFSTLPHILLQNWEKVAVLVLMIVLHLFAVRAVRRQIIPARPARLLCAIYFSTLHDPATRRPSRRILRLSILLASVVLFIFTCSPRVFPHHRPPLADPRIFSRSGHWDVLREHHFFRDPPPLPAESPNP